MTKSKKAIAEAKALKQKLKLQRVNRRATKIQPRLQEVLTSIKLPEVPTWGGEIFINGTKHSITNTCPSDGYLAMFSCNEKLAGELRV